MNKIKTIVPLFFNLDSLRLIAAENQQRVTAAILRDPDLAAVGTGIAQLFVDQLRKGFLIKSRVLINKLT